MGRAIPASSSSNPRRGCGRPVGVPASQFWSANSTLVPGGAKAGDRFGAALAAGDFNGDGFTDLAIGIPNHAVNGNSGAGAIMVLYGSPNGLTATNSSFPAPQYFDPSLIPDFTNSFSLAGAHFGHSLAWGNFNGDKISGRDIGDLAVGIPGASFAGLFGFGGVPNEGAVWIVFGGPGGLSFFQNRLVTEFDVTQDQPEDVFGTSLTSGDFNGDGFSDLAIGAPGATVNGHNAAGLVWVLYGSSSGLDPFATTTQHLLQDHPERGDQFGQVLAAGDFNGDGKSDLAVGVPLEDVGSLSNAGVVNVFFGSGTGLPVAVNQDWTLGAVTGGADEAGAQFGRALAAGDFNGDGFLDLAIGAPFKDVSGVIDAGQVNVIYGSSSGLSTTATRVPQTWPQGTQTQAGIPGFTQQRGDRFGSSLTAWNFGHNVETGITRPATADLAIGVPFRTVGTVSAAGAVVVLYGCFTCPPPGLNVGFPPQIWTQASPGVIGTPETDDHFGAALY